MAMIEATGAGQTPHTVMAQHKRQPRGSRGLFGKCYVDWTPNSFRTIVYTRYGDDICFSSPRSEFTGELEPKIRAVVAQFGLRLNSKRKTGEHGYLELPGVRIVKGRVEPDHKSIQAFAEAQSRNAAPQVLAGYRSFFNMFPKSGRRQAHRVAAALNGIKPSCDTQ